MAKSRKGRRENRRPFSVEAGPPPSSQCDPCAPGGADAPVPSADSQREPRADLRPAAPSGAPSPEPRWRRALPASAPALLLAAVLLIPFAGKAFTIDDTLFMRQAEWALSDPLHPSALTMVWSEVPRPMRLSQVMPTGPLMAWLLMPAALAGGSEVVAHLLQLLLLGIAILEVAVLALRMGYDESVARLSALFLAATPAVLGMAGTAMPDVAAMTFGLVGIERLYAWRQERGAAAGVMAALCLGLAPLARTHLLLLPAVAVCVLEYPWRRDAWRQWVPVVAAPAITMAIVLLTRDPLGGSADMARSAGFFSSLANVRSNAVAFGVHWVMLLPLGLAWMVTRGRRFWLSPVPWLGMAAAASALANDTRWLWIAPVAGLGIAVVADVVLDGWREQSADRVALGLWLLLALPIVVYLHFPSKYLVACAPAAAIVAAAAVLELPKRGAMAVGAGPVAGGALFGTLILQADATFAGLGKRAVEELVVPRVAAGERVWFNAHWGFQWYAERAGASIVTSTAPLPRPGDLLVSARVTIAGIPVQAFRKRELLATVSDDAAGGRILSSELGAGFYSNGWGYLPWVWGSTEVDRFE
ncbi:MAG: ArnT family glycosyltransferase, partial [Candidatus Binatia bacterium]